LRLCNCNVQKEIKYSRQDLIFNQISPEIISLVDLWYKSGLFGS
jgi:hypothetical protein